MLMLRSGRQLVRPDVKRVALTTIQRAKTSLKTAASDVAPTANRPLTKSWEIKMLYDGDCPLCMREVNFLRSRNAAGKIEFVDIASPDFSPEDNQNISFEEAMGAIHAILPDGTVITNVEVFRRLYEAVGLGWLYAVTKVEPVGHLADAVYGVWAKYRMQITGREDLSVILEKRRGKAATCRDVNSTD